MKPLNILMLSCGANAPYHMLKIIKTRYAKLFHVVGVDINQKWLIASSIYLDEFYQCPFSTDSKYYQFILDVCDKENINYVIPVLDIDQMLFYKENPDLISRNILSLGWSQSMIECFSGGMSLFDKKSIYKKLEENGIKCPKLFKSIDEIDETVEYFIKPINGFGSIGIGKRMGYELKDVDFNEYVIQEKCHNPEITIECFWYNGFLSTIARERIASKSGVCVKTKIYKDKVLEGIIQRIVGCIDVPYYFNVQFMRNENDEYVVIDLNLRCAGGMSLSYVAGWDVTSSLISIMLKKSCREICSFVNSAIEEQYVIRAYTDIVTKKIVKNIAFDLDGTLLDSRLRHISVMEDILKKYNINISANDLVEYKGQGLNNISWLLSHNIPVNLAETIANEWIVNVEQECYLQTDVLYSNTRLMLEKLSEYNNLFLITARKDRTMLEKQLKSLHVYQYFTKICIVDPLDNPQNHKSQFLIDNHVDFFVGDTEIDYEAAKLANTKFYAVDYGFRSRNFWEKFDVEYYTEYKQEL